jgi:hypothetical protein
MRILAAGLIGWMIFLLGLGVTAGFGITDGASVVGSVLGALTAAASVALAWPRLIGQPG